MSFVRGDIGISKPRVRLRTVSDGRKAFFADNFGGGGNAYDDHQPDSYDDQSNGNW